MLTIRDSLVIDANRTSMSLSVRLNRHQKKGRVLWEVENGEEFSRHGLLDSILFFQSRTQRGWNYLHRGHQNRRRRKRRKGRGKKEELGRRINGGKGKQTQRTKK